MSGFSDFPDHADLAGYVAGDVSSQEKQTIETHLAGCADCRAEVESLREMQEFLGEVPPEALLDGPPEGGDLLLQRTLRQVRSEARSSAGRGRFLAATAAVVVAAAAMGVGVVVGKAGSPAGPAVAVPPPPAPVPSTASSTVPGTKFLSGTSGETRLTASIVPAAGWVRVEAAVTGIPAGEKCRLIVVSKNGDREIAGGWLVSQKAVHDGADLNGSALVDPSQVASIVVENTEGHQFVEANV
ncbi:zf-HC2 domain-containing protein [Amycolatopsis sp. NPDC051372]|uniref:anti-sigma factor family protein n=1 Tax=Amycolatopsis sp. NPDC051372 TaxID=3155669 RepID=UPI00342CE34B